MKDYQCSTNRSVKAELIARLNSPSPTRAARAVRLLATDHKMTQREIAKASSKSLGWVNAMFRWTPNDQTSPFGPTTKKERVQHAKRQRFKRRNRARQAAQGEYKSVARRIQTERPKRRRALVLTYDHHALTDRSTVFPSTVASVTSNDTVLKPGANQSKVGGLILKGKWRGFPIVCLTLEERATCPTGCRQWASCYGNNMHLAKRFRYGGELEKKLVEEVAQLARAHPNGFAVRLHILGDFYSVEYVELWQQLLKRHPALHIWGYTARWDLANDPIAKAVVELANEERDRFKIRFSDGPDTLSLPKTISVQCDVQVPSDSLRCPQQGRDTETCSTCALCWESEKRIAFRQH